MCYGRFMRILVLYDTAALPRKSDVETALTMIKLDYLDCTDVSWTYEERDFSTLTWEEYLPGSNGISWSIVNKDMKVIYARDGLKWDNVIYVVDHANWKAPGIGGWSLGTPIKGYQVQEITLSTTINWIYKTFAMEIMHGNNDLTIQELGDNLISLFQIPNDWDDRVVHGCDKRYGVNVPDNPSLSGYYTNYDYRPIIAIAKDTLKKAYDQRLAKYQGATPPPPPDTTFKFKNNLSFGMKGSDVSELQRRFIAEGLATYGVTSYFGPLTKASAIAYQKKYGINPALGYVGPLTRASLNSVASAAPDAMEAH